MKRELSHTSGDRECPELIGALLTAYCILSPNHWKSGLSLNKWGSYLIITVHNQRTCCFFISSVQSVHLSSAVDKMGKSSVWVHFLREKGGSKCKYCSSVINSGSSTGGLWYHLRSKHPGTLEDAAFTKRSFEDDEPAKESSAKKIR